MSVSERENAAVFIEFTTVTPFTYRQGNFKCFYCEETFTEVHAALNHTTSHATLNKDTLMKQYLKCGKRVIKADISGLMCRICEQKYSELDNIRSHLINKHKKVFKTAGNGLMAYNLSINNGYMSCLKCSKEFNSFFTLNRHMNEHDNVVCETCGLGFVNHLRLSNHRLIHQNGSHKCEQCPKVFATKLRLRNHVDRYHEVTNVKKIKRLKCPHCFERFGANYKKVAHMKEAHGITFSFDCQECKLVFPSRRRLTAHTRIVHTQNIQCKICGKCFGSAVALNMHMRGHTGQRNFSCAICQKAYMHEKLLRKHVKTHADPFTFSKF